MDQNIPDSRFIQLKANSSSSDITCYVCLQMLQRKPSWQQSGSTKICLLCNNDYCDDHKSKDETGACEINHQTYCSKERHRLRHHPIRIFCNMNERASWIVANGNENIAGGSEGLVEVAAES